MPTASGRLFHPRAPAGDLAHHCLPQALSSANHIGRGSAARQLAVKRNGHGRMGWRRSSAVQPDQLPGTGHNGFTVPVQGSRTLQPPRAGAQRSTAHGRQIPRVSLQSLRENIWYLREFSWSGSHCVFSVHTLFLYSLVSCMFRREIISELACVGPHRSWVGAEGDLPVVNSPWITCWSPLGCRSTRRSRRTIHKKLKPHCSEILEVFHLRTREKPTEKQELFGLELLDTAVVFQHRLSNRLTSSAVLIHIDKKAEWACNFWLPLGNGVEQVAGCSSHPAGNGQMWRFTQQLEAGVVQPRLYRITGNLSISRSLRNH